MQKRYAWGLVAAALLGSAAGVAIAPPPARSALRRRAKRNVARLRSRYRAWLASPRVDASLATDRLKSAIAQNPRLGKRRIWVDAHGATILLHGVVESEEEWRLAARLARSVSVGAPVRNLLQIRRASTLG